MSFYDSSDAIYGVARYGVARYGIVVPTVNLTGVSATIRVRSVDLDIFEVGVIEIVYGAADATGSVGSLTLNLVEKLESAPAVGSVGTPTPVVTVFVVPVDATTEINTVQVNVSEVLASISAEFSVNAGGLDVRSINRVDIFGADNFGQIGTPKPNVSEPVLGLTASVSISATRQNLSKTVNTSALVSYVGDVTHSNLTRVRSVSLVTSVGEVRENLRHYPPSQILSTGVGTLSISNTKTLSTPVLVISAGQTDETGVVFDFYAVRNLYSAKRTVLIPRAA